MATIQWTSYKFHTPHLINELDYNSIKEKQRDNKNYNPFYVESYFSKFRIGLIGYFIVGPISVFLYSGAESLSYSDFILLEYLGYILMFITGLYLFVLFGGLFNAVPTSFSYLKYLFNHKLYYSNLLKNVKISNDYDEFIGLMSKQKNYFHIFLAVFIVILGILILINS